ncbi:DNAJ heat shock N-terminal domain-containing protein [Euphorbia peplus]|nr:DNAJ heat shock N-terminal domain-containing protein [Euphorbia peplus]
MDCNKEEAFRARGIAEQKMQSKDFISARKIALKAQQLYRDLDNISQILMVCDVHCSSEKKIAGNEMDWYDILQIEQTADEATIKKQYRKFALLLHPDKNNFPGAESAFKLIGEAQRVLLDKSKRHLHDVKRKTFVSKPAPAYRPQPRPTYTQNIGAQNNYRNNVPGVNSQPPQQVGQQRPSNGRATFWTACPFCNVKYEYYIEVLNKSLICQTCSKPFIAYERTAQGANLNRSTVPPRRDGPVQGFSKVELNSQTNSTAGRSKTDVFQRKVGSSELGSQRVNSKRRRKKDAESSDSFDSDSSMEDDDFTTGVNLDSNGERPRRSDRRRQNVSYRENGSDDEEYSGHPKKAKGSRSSYAAEEENINGSEGDMFKTSNSGLASGVKDQNGEQENGGPKRKNDAKNVKGKERAEDGGKESSEAASDFSSKPSSDRELYEYAEPDFNDFEKGRSQGSFSSGQVWALYDSFGAMPRFYARIRKVFLSNEFKLRITWLEPVPGNEDEHEWVNNGLPVSCGKFKEGTTENTEELLMFSHIVSWERGNGKDIYKIFPKKGQTWAIIKNWSLEWSKSQKESYEKFEHEVVEVLSDYTEGVGATVAYLGKLKGFVCVFCRLSMEGNSTFQIPQGELYRFSHMIPSFKLTDKEKRGVPEGSFELDPASLPTNIDEIAAPKDFVVKVDNSHRNGSCSGSYSDKVKAESDPYGVENEVEIVSDDEDFPATTNPKTFEIPDAEFFDFDAVKANEKFEVGQIWSLYCDEDSLPKYYARITKVAPPQQGFKVGLRWLASSKLPDNAIQWNDPLMPICCGSFEPRKAEGQQTYTTTVSFSHQVSASTGNKREYAIMPKKGQVWALYKNWAANMSLRDLENCEYDVVEVLEENSFRIKVLFLEKVDGFKSVFKAQRKEGSPVTTDVFIVELLRFSHQIPAFRLTTEENGSLKGFWELDPAALPIHFFAQ